MPMRSNIDIHPVYNIIAILVVSNVLLRGFLEST